jgi:hypothetical protein
MLRIAQGNTTEPIPFLLVLAADHLTPATGRTPVVTISKNGGAYATPAGAVTELANGWYLIAANALDADTIGLLSIHVTATSADPVDWEVEVVAAALAPASSQFLLTPLDLIRRAMLLITAIAAGETPTAEEAQDGLERLNELIDAWGADDLTIPGIVRTPQALVSGTQTYTIGPTGTLVQPRPTTEPTFTLVGSDGFEYPLDPLTRGRWMGLQLRTQTSPWPYAFHYEASFPNATLSLYPVPTDSGLQLAIYSPEALTQFPALNTRIILPPGYARALRYNLAMELAPEYGKAIPPRVEIVAAESLGAIKVKNVTVNELSLDVALIGHGGAPSDIYSGN